MRCRALRGFVLALLTGGCTRAGRRNGPARSRPPRVDDHRGRVRHHAPDSTTPPSSWRSTPNRSAATAQICRPTSATSSRTTSVRPARGHLPPADFLDDPDADDYSARVANALFAAAAGGVEDVGAPARNSSASSRTLWANQDPADRTPPTTRSPTSPATRGLPTTSSAEIGAGEAAVDTIEHGGRQLRVPVRGRPDPTPARPRSTTCKGEKLDIYDNDWLAKLMRRLTVKPRCSTRQPAQRRAGHQPADHRDRPGGNDRQRRVAVLHPNQVGIGLVVLDVNPHARVQFGRIQHAEFGPVGDAVGCDELDRGAPRARV